MSAKRTPQPRPIRIVPLHGRPTPPLVHTRAALAAQLTYRGGSLLRSVQAVSVFWGAAWNESPLSGTALSV
jgi:hypothetical protein